MHPDRELLFRLGSKSLTKLLTLQDRNPHSLTYGCFDRNFWHFRITDFPSGMAQEFVLPLALSYAAEFQNNEFYKHPTIREWIRAGIAYAARSTHPDGSCDDYYPFEKAAGAAAFSLYAIQRSIELAELDYREFESFLRLRAEWLANHMESGRLSNHEALISNNLFRLSRLLGDESFAVKAKKRLDRLLSWQSDEGWFFEYQGCDPGYMTLTIGNLAEIDEAYPEFGLKEPITKAVHFLLKLQPPDGWLGGEWTSRNTNNYFPHGIEICSKWMPEASLLNDASIRALRNAPDYDDDHILAHHAWSYLLAARDWNDRRESSGQKDDSEKQVYFSQAGLLKMSRGNLTLLVSLNKGGNFRIYDGDNLIHSDTGVSLLISNGNKSENYVSHLWCEENEITISDDGVQVKGKMGKAKASQMTPFKNIVLRCLMLTIGRFKPDLVRQLLQKLLITGKSDSPFQYSRRFTVKDDGITVEDEVNRLSGNGKVLSAGIGAAQTSIYTVMSRVYHHPQLQPWTDLTDEMQQQGKALLSKTRHWSSSQ